MYSKNAFLSANTETTITALASNCIFTGQSRTRATLSGHANSTRGRHRPPQMLLAGFLLIDWGSVVHTLGISKRIHVSAWLRCWTPFLKHKTKNDKNEIYADKKQVLGRQKKLGSVRWPWTERYFIFGLRNSKTLRLTNDLSQQDLGFWSMKETL